jgi:hypothetical protein
MMEVKEALRLAKVAGALEILASQEKDELVADTLRAMRDSVLMVIREDPPFGLASEDV